MNTNLSLEKCLAFVNCQLQPPRKGSERNGHNRRLAVTFSRQAGCGAHAIAEKLAQRLQERGAGTGAPWTLFGRNLVEKVLENHSLPKRLARFMPEDRISEIEDTIGDLFGLQPLSWMLVGDFQTDDPVACRSFLVALLEGGLKILTIKHEAIALTQHEFDALVKNAATTLAAKQVGKSLDLDAEEVHYRFGLAA